MAECEAKQQEQSELRVVASRLPTVTPGRFDELVNRTLEEMEFAAKVSALCVPACADAPKGGRPPIDPLVCFKMLMAGFLENLPGERTMASRCGDSRIDPAFSGLRSGRGYAGAPDLSGAPASN